MDSAVKSQFLLLVFTLAFGASVGYALRLTVPFMSTGMSNWGLIILSGAAMLLFLPSWLTYLLHENYWAATLIQLVVGVSAGMVSSYFWDSLLSCLLVGIMASLTLWIVTFFRDESGVVYWAAGAVGLLASLLNVVGHSLGDRPPSVYVGLGLSTLIVSLLAALLAHWASQWL